ncbi:NAD(+) synthase [Candidatus Gracilibacteria bacterium]|nr:NAD(+) synthase [Candidatus Gracilibacteria bacterium]
MKTILEAPMRDLNYPEIAKDISRWIGEKSLDKGLVVGVSGGIDSAVVSTLSAMSGKALTCLELPIHQKTDEVNRAREHIDWLQQKYTQVTRQIIDLTQVYDAMQALQYPGDDEASEYLSDVNLRSRLRAAQLYATANRKNALVVGTGNKVEDYGIGFFTKYGDGAVDLSPIGELTKSEVYKLGRELGIHEDILNARPTDGLHPSGATDEDQIGASYDELEWAMNAYDIGKRISDYSGRAQEVMKIYTERHEGNAHKMHMPPVYQVLDPQKGPEHYGVHQ